MFLKKVYLIKYLQNQLCRAISYKCRGCRGRGYPAWGKLLFLLV